MGYKFNSEEEKKEHYAKVKKLAQDRYRENHKEELRKQSASYYYTSGRDKLLKKNNIIKMALKQWLLNFVYCDDLFLTK